MSGPAFWTRSGLLSLLLAPLQPITARRTAARLAQPGWRAPVPVICCGNATVGGTGKTPLALDLAARLRAAAWTPAFLSRGHGGARQFARQVDPGRDTAAVVGDEPLLLAAVAPTWVGADRAASARAAIAAGADILILDDGLQNQSVEKTLSFLVIDGGAGFGNGRLLPAGPLREAVEDAAARCQAAVLIGEDSTAALTDLPPDLPVLRARFRPGEELRQVRGRKVMAFAGIGRPAKFFRMLEAHGVDLAAMRGFADHHRYRRGELAALRRRAASLRAMLVTTEKDYVRLPRAARVDILPITVGLEWEEPAALEALLETLPRPASGATNLQAAPA